LLQVATSTVPLSIDNVFATTPELGDAGRNSAAKSVTESERQEFAVALERVQKAEPGPSSVRPTRTRLSGDQAASALGAAWEQALGRAPNARTLSILTGQWAHETGRGAAMLNYNFGGIKGSGPSGMSTVYKTREGWGADEVHTSDRFRAYGSAAEGARDYVGLLVRRYPNAVQAAERGDPSGFVQALKAGGYFTGNEASYIKSVSALAEQALVSGYDSLGGAAGATATATASGPPNELAALSPEFGLGATQAGSAAAHWAPHSFADEVSRAALLMSALRIGRNDEPKG
jgi:mannosyl-glycoprotein endo-beta-N-acetylglucosaminidase